MLNAGDIVILSGPPGSGKTSTAAGLAASAPLGVHLESDVFYQWIASGFVAPHRPEAQAQNTAVMDVVADTAASYADAGYAVVWDGIVGPWFVDRIVKRLAARGRICHYLVLRPERDVALARVRDRDGTPETSGAETMYDQFADLGSFEPHVVVPTGDAEAVVSQCVQAMAARDLVPQGTPWVDDRWPVSVKGVVGWGNSVVVLRNGRGEWELPGGRLDATDASPQAALRREFGEELGLDVDVGALVDSWIYDVEGKRVLILTYSCRATKPAEFRVSDEHDAVAERTLEQLRTEPIPTGYVRSIEAHLRRDADVVMPDVGPT